MWFHPWFHGISMRSELPEFTRTHCTVAMPPGCGWAGQNCGIWKFSLPGWYCIVTQRDFHTNKGHEMIHSLERSIGLESIRLILHGSDSFIIGLLGLDALHWECGFGYLVYFFTLVGGDACLLRSHWRCSSFSLLPDLPWCTTCFKDASWRPTLFLQVSL